MQHNTIRLFLLSISLLTFTPHQADCSSNLEDSDLCEDFEDSDRWKDYCEQLRKNKKRKEEEIKKFKQFFTTLTAQNINEKLVIHGQPRTPLEVVITDTTYRKQISSQEYEQNIDHLLALGADPCAGCSKDRMLVDVAAQGNYRIFAKIVACIAPTYIDSWAFKDAIVNVTNHGIEPTSDTVQILADLVDLGATIDEQYREKRTLLFWMGNTPETLQFFLDRGVDQLKKDNDGKTCLCYYTEQYHRSIQDIQYLIETIKNPRPVAQRAYITDIDAFVASMEKEKADTEKNAQKIQARTNTLQLNLAFNAYHVTQHPDGTTSPGWKDTLFGKTFVHACLHCFQGNPELIKKIIIQSNKQAVLARKLEKLLNQDQWATFLIPAITSQLPPEERVPFLNEVPDVLKMTKATRNQANPESPE